MNRGTKTRNLTQPVKSDITSIFFEPGEEGSLAHVAIGRFFNHLPNFKQKGVKSFAAVPWPHWKCVMLFHLIVAVNIDI